MHTMHAKAAAGKGGNFQNPTRRGIFRHAIVPLRRVIPIIFDNQKARFRSTLTIIELTAIRAGQARTGSLAKRRQLGVCTAAPFFYAASKFSPSIPVSGLADALTPFGCAAISGPRAAHAWTQVRRRGSNTMQPRRSRRRKAIGRILDKIVGHHRHSERDGYRETWPIVPT